jgi:hypothetical protein
VKEQKAKSGRDKKCSLIRTKNHGKWQGIFANAVLLRMGRRQHDF